MELLDILRLQLEWGADEFLLDAPQRRAAATPPPPQAPAAPPKRHLVPLATLPPSQAETGKLAAACKTLEDLRAALQNFKGCALAETATQLVFADGADKTNLLFIGEAPGGEEDRVGRPFVGPAGQLLDKMLASIQLDRSKIRIVNTVPWRPPGNRTPTDTEIAICLPFLHRHIALINPGCIVLLGAVAAKTILPHTAATGIRRLRGQWTTLQTPGATRPAAILPTYHPAYLLRTPAAKRDSWHDFIAVRQWLNNQEN